MGRKSSKKRTGNTNTDNTSRNNKRTGRKWLLPMLGAVAIIGGGLFFLNREPQAAPDMVVYKSPSCGCCEDWISYLEKNGFTVDVENVGDMDPVKQRLGVPGHAASCHTAKIGDYVIEGHVPVEDLRRLIREKPNVAGIAAPGMPTGSPGMEIPGEPADRYDVVTFTQDGQTKVFARH